MSKAAVHRVASGSPVGPFETVWSRSLSVATGGTVYQAATYLGVYQETSSVEVLTGAGIEVAPAIDYGLYIRRTTE